MLAIARPRVWADLYFCGSVYDGNWDYCLDRGISVFVVKVEGDPVPSEVLERRNPTSYRHLQAVNDRVNDGDNHRGIPILVELDLNGCPDILTAKLDETRLSRHQCLSVPLTTWMDEVWWRKDDAEPLNGGHCHHSGFNPRRRDELLAGVA